MNATLLIGLWRQRLTSPVRAVILGLMVLIPPLLARAIHGVGLSALGDAMPIAMVFAVGMIGQDVSSGVLQLVLARPVTRWEYVFTRWLAVALGASLVSLLQIGLAWALLSSAGQAPATDTVVLFAANRELQIFGVAAAMALLSTLIGGVGDLALYVMLSLFGGIVSMIGQMRNSQALLWAGHELGALLSPQLDLGAMLAGASPWLPIATYLSNLTLCLCAAVWIMNRKELSYASG